MKGLTPEVTGATRVAGLRPVDRVVMRQATTGAEVVGGDLDGRAGN